MCAGGTVTFDDLSLLSPTSWNWSFPGGTPSTSSAANPVVTYNTPGIYAVTLTASNVNGSGSTMTKPGYITVYAVPTTACTVTRTEAPAVNIGIFNVAFHTIDHATAWDGPVMNDYSCTQIAQLQPNTNYPIAVTVGGFNNQWVRVYIDYNGNGLFGDQPDEFVFSPANGTGVRSGSFTTPAAPTTGVLRRMRVITDFVNTTPGPCTNPVQYGQVEDYAVVFTPAPGIAVAPKVFLEGAYSATTGLMNDALRSLGTFPLEDPYPGLGYSHTGAGGGSLLPAVLATSGNDAIVDWVVIELRSDAQPAVVLASRSVLLQRDGDIVDPDGISPVAFAIAPGSYHVAIRHRNHLGAMTTAAIALSPVTTSVDFSTNATITYGSDARKSLSGAFPAMVLWSGDVGFNGDILYTGSGNDRDPVLIAVGSTTPNNVLTGAYSTRDVNMNGEVKYTGIGNDRDPILINVGSTTPNSVRIQQLP